MTKQTSRLSVIQPARHLRRVECIWAQTCAGTLVFVVTACALGSFASAQVCFEATHVVTVGTQPTAQALADFNGDGVVDLALLEPQVSAVAVHLGRSDSSFAPAVRYPVPVSSSQLAAADIDQDGALDLVMVGSFVNVCVVRNLGGATFAPPVQFGTGLSGLYMLTALSVVDFDNDGDPDLALARTLDFGSTGVSTEVGIMDNQGGAFPVAPQWVSTGPQGRGPRIVAFDVDADGDRDLGVATTQPSGDASARLFVNQGGVLLAAQLLQAPPGSAASILSADYDADGFADLAIATPTSVSILRNLGNSTFAPPIPTPASTQLFNAASGDLDSDGDADIVSIQVSSNAPAVVVYRNQGSLLFALEGPYPVASTSDAVLAQDLDGDGDRDLCVMSTTGKVVTLLANPGNGVFSPGPDYSLGGSLVLQMRAVDVDVDGDLDLIGADIYANRWSTLLNDGSGAFGAVIPTPLGIGVEKFTTLDYDADGRVDLASTSLTGVVALHRNTVNGLVFAGSYTVGYQPQGVTSADLDGDLDLDLVVANTGDHTISVLFNQGGVFGPQATYPAWFGPRVIAAGDLDGDGDLDLVVANLGISVLLNLGAGTFGPPANYAGFGTASSIVLGDLDSDGDLDVAASCSVGIVVFPNAGNSILGQPVNYPVNGDPSDLAVRDLDGDGDLDLVGLIASSRIMITLLNQGAGTFAQPEGYFLAGAPNSLVCDDFDGDGDFDVAVARDFSPSSVKLLRNCGVSGTVVCAGDGLGTACPCANNSPVAARAGCLNSLGSGGSLRGSGSAVLALDQLVLSGTQMQNGAALYFQGLSVAGSGAVFGDGLLCAGSGIVRLGIKMNVGGQSVYPGPSDPAVSASAAIATPGERYYQVWYRDAASFCTSATFNLSNALRVAWQP